MDAVIKDGKLVLTLDWDNKGWETEKMRLHASSHGFQTIVIDGKAVRVSVNAGVNKSGR
jgi:hypothetical protein